MRLLPKNGKPISSIDLADKIYSKEFHASTVYARQSVVALMRSLIDKAKTNKEPFVIERSERCGPYPTEYRRVEK